MRENILNIIPPGVYIDNQDNKVSNLELAPTAIAGFMGICERGPMDKAVEIRDMNDFYTTFGKPVRNGFLAPAVEGFFRNGGRICHIIRIGHKGRLSDEGDRVARLDIMDGKGEPTLRFMAGSEGSWGNDLQVSIKKGKSEIRTLLTLDAKKGANIIRVSSTYGLSRGLLIKISSDNQEAYRYITDIRGKELSWNAENPLKKTFRVDGPTHVEPVDFEVHIKYGNLVEVFKKLSFFKASPNYVVRVINTQSTLVRVIDLGSPSDLPLNLPQETDFSALQNGFEDISQITPDDFIGAQSNGDEKRGLAALDAVEDIELILAPDLMFLYQYNREDHKRPFSSLSDIKVVQDTMLTHCEMHRDRFAILDSPFPDDIERTRDWRQEFDSAHGAMYFPWIKTYFENQDILLPPSGHVAGIYAASDAATGVHKIPANMPMEFVSDLSVVLWEEDIGILNSNGIDCLRSIPAMGITIWGGRTLSSASDHKYINVRRTMSAVIRSLDSFMQWVVFEPNTRSLWKVITRQVGYFLTTLWRNGYLQGQTPEEAFFVKCDDENNPEKQRNDGMLVVDIGLAPVKPTEYILFRMAQEMQEVGGE